MDAARRATAGGDRIAVDGARARRTQEGDDEGHLLGIDQVLDRIAGGVLAGLGLKLLVSR